MAFRPVKEYVMTISSDTALTAVDLTDATKFPVDIAGSKLKRQVRIRALTCDIVVKFGSASNTLASRTVTSSALADKNFTVEAGAVELFTLASTDTYVSVQNFTAGETGKAFITLGYGEKI